MPCASEGPRPLRGPGLVKQHKGHCRAEAHLALRAGGAAEGDGGALDQEVRAAPAQRGQRARAVQRPRRARRGRLRVRGSQTSLGAGVARGWGCKPTKTYLW